jgi:hypothetical protein
MGIESTQIRAQFFGHHIGFHRVMAAQRGIRTADQDGIDDPPARRQVGQGQLQVVADLRVTRGARRVHAPGIGQDEEQGGVVQQGGLQGDRIPPGQQQAGMHRLGAGRVVVEDDDLGFGHGGGSSFAVHSPLWKRGGWGGFKGHSTWVYDESPLSPLFPRGEPFD